jgi:hypothetical protein
MRDDQRKENIRFPKIDFETFIYKNFKDLIAAFFVLLSLLVLVFSTECRDSERMATILTSLISASLGFIFGKKVS